MMAAVLNLVEKTNHARKGRCVKMGSARLIAAIAIQVAAVGLRLMAARVPGALRFVRIVIAENKEARIVIVCPSEEVQELLS